MNSDASNSASSKQCSPEVGTLQSKSGQLRLSALASMAIMGSQKNGSSAFGKQCFQTPNPKIKMEPERFTGNPRFGTSWNSSGDYIQPRTPNSPSPATGFPPQQNERARGLVGLFRQGTRCFREPEREPRPREKVPPGRSHQRDEPPSGRKVQLPRPRFVISPSSGIRSRTTSCERYPGRRPNRTGSQ